MTDRWFWEKPDAARSGAAGDLAKLFKNEQIEQPGVLSKGAPNVQATVLAREVIQNSWDAAGDLRDDLRRDHIKAARSGRGSRSTFRPPPFEVRFHFHTADGASKEKLVRELALAEHAGRISGGGGVAARMPA